MSSHPGLVPVRPGDRVKTDPRDARKLARLHAGGLLEAVTVPSEQVEALRDLVRAREDARIDRMRDRHRMSKFLLRHGLRMPNKSWGATRRTWLGSLTFEYERATRLLAPLADDLHAWHEACGMPSEDAPVIVNGRGEPWAHYDWDNWRSRTFRAAATAAGLRAGKDDGARRVRPRDLRSSFATLLIYEGQPPQYVAEQLGHSPATLLRDYARVWEDFDPAQRVSAEAQIERVRARLQRAKSTTRATRDGRRRSSQTSPRGGRVPQVFHDAAHPSSQRPQKAWK